jgi:demethylmenaquinone methyltransferase / 2-methoxy-6-polyprenyl-1,4-benzoquinol methylase
MTKKEKPLKKSYRPLQKIFMEVTHKYDILNRIMTLGIDEFLRKNTVKELLDNNPKKILDLCTGTGDLILRLAKKKNKNTQLIGLDFSPPMLEIAKEKEKKKNIKDIEWIEGDAANMPFADNELDAIGISYAFRNLTYQNPDQQKFLKEICRVCKPGGKFVIVETSQPKTKIMKFLLVIYMNVMVRLFGGMVSGQASGYKYLAQSAINYFTPEQVVDLLTAAGFSKASYKQYVGGVFALHVAVK